MPELLSHQHRAVPFLAERAFACLWDETGTGKTISTIAAADAVGARRILVFAPAAVRRVWEDELLDWQKIDRSIHVIENSKEPLPQERDSVTILSHQALVQPKLLNALYRSQYYDLIVLDEAAELRQFSAQRTRNFFGDNGVWTLGARVWCLTATPVVNSATDLYPLAYGPLTRAYGPAPSLWDFGMRFAERWVQGHDSYRAIGLKNEDELAAALRPFVLRRTLQGAGINLPPLHVAPRSVVLSPNDLAAVYRHLEGWDPARLEAVLQSQDSIEDSGMAQARHVLGLAKVPAVVAQVRDIMAEGQGPVVVFFHHTDVRERLYETLTARGLKVSWLDGKCTRTQVRAARVWFQDGRLDVLLVQTQAGGMGLTLTRAHNVVVAELPWTATALHQAIARVHRMTQTQPCEARIVLARGVWLDDVMSSLVQKKKITAAKLLTLLETDNSSV